MIKKIHEVVSLDHDGLELYRTLKRPQAHRDMGIFIVEGSKVVERIFQSSIQVISILLTKEWFSQYKEIISSRSEPISVYIADKTLLQQIVGFNYHQAIMAVARVPESQTLESAVNSSQSPRMFAALDSLESSENVGVIVRNCAACGINTLIIGETTGDPYLRRAVRNSMGNVFKLSVVYSRNLGQSLRELSTRFGFTNFAAHPKPDSISLDNVLFTGDCCMVLGNEADGISNAILDTCAKAITIPMREGIDSFNVACASAIIFYEMARQRTMQLSMEQSSVEI